MKHWWSMKFVLISRTGRMRCCECCSLSGRSSRKTPSSHLKAETFTDFRGTSPTLADENDQMVCSVWSWSSPVHKCRMCGCCLTQAPHPHGVGSPAAVALVRRTPVIQVLQVIHNLQGKAHGLELFSLKHWDNEVYDQADPRRNAQPVHTDRERADKKITSNIWWWFSIMRDLLAW